MYRIVFLSVSILFITGCKNKNVQVLPYYNTPDFTPQFLSGSRADGLQIHQIADFSFTDQNNQQITQQNIENKIHVANFFFTSCSSICPKMMQNLVVANRELSRFEDVAILSYSVTPWIDSVPRLKKFANVYEITNPNWHLLTGNKAAIYTLARKSYFAEEDLGFTKDSSEFLHTEHILLVDKKKRIRGIYNGTLPLETEQLVKDIIALRKDE
jgi:protein SCO1/2